MYQQSRTCPLPLPPIRLAPDVYRHYRQTIAQHPPETCALLGGYLDDPFLVTDFRFCPPQRQSNGGFNASSSHINIDHDLMNWIVDHEWKPSGRYMIGIWHSHPNGTTRPSIGDTASNSGDLPFFTSCLESDDSPGRNWRHFLAPITTFGSDGQDRLHGWVLSRGSTFPRPALIIIDPVPVAALADLAAGGSAFPLPSHISRLVVSEQSNEALF